MFVYDEFARSKYQLLQIEKVDKANTVDYNTGRISEQEWSGIMNISRLEKEKLELDILKG
jgi:hypothetical protein